MDDLSKYFFFFLKTQNKKHVFAAQKTGASDPPAQPLQLLQLLQRLQLLQLLQLLQRLQLLELLQLNACVAERVAHQLANSGARCWRHCH